MPPATLYFYTGPSVDFLQTTSLASATLSCSPNLADLVRSQSIGKPIDCYNIARSAILADTAHTLRRSGAARSYQQCLQNYTACNFGSTSVYSRRVQLCRLWRHQIDAVGGHEYDSPYASSLYLKRVVCITNMR